jgi:hypothetical protein
MAARQARPDDPGYDQAESELDPEEPARALRVLNEAGVRLMEIDGTLTIGMWSDLDGPEIRGALRSLNSAELPVRYLVAGRASPCLERMPYASSRQLACRYVALGIDLLHYGVAFGSSRSVRL